MKNCIIYASKTGTTKRCANLLAANLGAENCELFDISGGEPDFSSAETVVLGSYIRMGVIDKKIASFLEKNKEALFEKKFGIFLCGCLEEKVSDAIVKNFSEDILEKAVSVDFFGGELAAEKQKGLDKLLIKSLLKIAEKDPNFNISNGIYAENITAFAAEISK